MFPLKYLIGLGGIAAVGGGVGIYYANQSSGQSKATEEPEAPSSLQLPEEPAEFDQSEVSDGSNLSRQESSLSPGPNVPGGKE